MFSLIHKNHKNVWELKYLCRTIVFCNESNKDSIAEQKVFSAVEKNCQISFQPPCL